MKLINVFSLVMLTFSVYATTSPSAISVNYVSQPNSDEAINGIYGVMDGLNTDAIVGGWINTVDGSIPNATLRDGRETAVSISTINEAGSGTSTATSYDNSPLHAWAIAGIPSSSKPVHATIDNLNEVFPSGYKIIVYLNGHPRVGNARIYLTENGGAGDLNTGSDPFYSYKTIWTPSNYSGTPVQTIQNTGGTVPLAQFAIFDSLNADKVTLTLETIATSGGGAGLSGFQIVGDVDDEYVFGQTDIPEGAVLYNDFSHYLYKDYSIAAGGTANPTYHNKKNFPYIGGSSKGVFVRSKRNPYVWNDSSTWFVNHSYAFKFADTNATNSKYVAPSDSTGGTALKVGFQGPRMSTGTILLNTGIKFDPSLNYTVTIRAKIKDEVDSAVLTNAVGNVSLSAGFGNLARVRNPYAIINQAATNGLTTTNWTEVSVDVYGGNLAENAIFGENAFASSGFGPNSSNHRIPNNKINLDNYYPQELMVSIGRSPDSTNTLDHSTWVDWIKIETNNYLDSVASGYGLSSTNLLGDSDSDGQSDLVEIATGGNPTNTAIKGAGLSIISFKDVVRPIYITNNITILPNQNDDGQVQEIINYPVTNFVLTNDAKYGITNLIANEHRFGGSSWTNFVEHVTDASNTNAVKWKDTIDQIIDVNLSNYTYNVVTLNDSAHVTNNNVILEVEILGSWTNSLDNGVDILIPSYGNLAFTNKINVTKTGELSVVGYQTNSIVRFKRPRSANVSNLGCKYSIASRDSLTIGSWTNSGTYNFGDVYNPSNFPGVEMGTSTAPQASDGGFLQLRVTSPDNDPSTFYFDTFPDTDYGAGDPGN